MKVRVNGQLLDDVKELEVKECSGLNEPLGTITALCVVFLGALAAYGWWSLWA